MVHNKTRFFLRFRRVAEITLAWIIVGAIMAFDSAILLDPSTETYIYYVPNGHSLVQHVLYNLIGPFLGGVFGGSFLVFFMEERTRNRPFTYVILVQSLVYMMIILAVIIVVSFFYQTNAFQKSPFDSEVVAEVWKYLSGFGLWKTFLTWCFIVLATVFILQVSKKYGPGVLKRFILGRYYKPHAEQRIFMFCDIKSSTTIAEKLGNQRYFLLLRDFFSTITESILVTKGEIYQYVGDEIVLSWPVNRGFHNNNCVECFFEMERAVQRRAEHFYKEYGLIPDFKAGLHYGQITSGEIGDIKKDIVYSGDVMNTTSRIQELCNSYGKRLILSKDLLERLDLEQNYISREIGEIELRGKETKIRLYTVLPLTQVQEEVVQRK